MSTIEELQTIAVKWFDAFNAKNLDELLALYDDHAHHYSPKLKVRQPETQGWIKGKAALRAWWQDSFDRLPTLLYEPRRVTPYADRVFMEYIRHVAGEEDMYIGELLEVEDGKIVTSMVFHR